ncbi:MAG: hypothetical protein IKO35_04050, partial [Elusimicrobiaceae bacterium]|nr:hypothetical protein [Elusimicrobiaceae bacterium]
AFLVWCVVDVMKLLAKGSRLLTSGFRFLQDLRKVSRLAKNGATVFQRAKMVSRLNIPAKLDKIYGINIKFVNKMQPVVLSQVPQFAPLPFKLPDYTIKTGEILAQGLTFDREAGQLTLTGKKALRAQGLSPKMIYDADNALKRASLNANTAFAEAKISPSKLFGNKNRLYKKTLATEVSTELAKVVGQSEVMPLALRTRDLAIKTPFIEIERIREASQAAKEALAPEQKARIKKQIFWLSVATGLSLSSASSGLINPLQDTFGTQITETDKIWITLALPYVASFGSAFITPFVKKWGTLNILKSSFGFSMAGLATAGLAGYYGKVDTNNLPPLWPLFVSGAAIGISAALSRATLNGLIKTLDPSGASLLGSMLWKNIGSVALVAPAVLFNMGYNIHKNIKGEKIQKTDGSDFSLAFPVLAGLSGAMWFKVSRLKIDKEIGKVAGFMPFNKIDWKAPLSWPKMFAKNTWSFLSNTGKDGMYALKLMGTKEVLPLVLATTAFTGFESAVFNKAGNQLLKPKIQNSLDNGEGSSNIFTADNNLKNTAAFLATAGIAVFPALARKSSGKLVAGMRSLKEGTEYRRMLGLSYALNISGATLLSMNGLDSWTGWLGLSMLGLGTANVTQSFQNLANARVVKSAPVMKELSGLNATARKDVIKAANTSMTTAFSTSQIGLALVPWFVGNRTDTLENKGIIERKDGPLSTLWIPATSIGISLGLATPALLGKWKFKLPPVGTVAASKGIFGSYPAAFKNVRGYLQDWGLISKPIENSLTFPAGFSPLPAIEQTPTVTNPPDIQVNTQKPAEDMPQQ